MKKINIYILILSMLITVFTGFSTIAMAESGDGYINTGNVRIRTGPSTDSEQFKIDGVNQVFEENQKVTVIDEKKDKNNETWYQVTFVMGGTEYTQWVYGEYVTFYSQEDKENEDNSGSEEKENQNQEDDKNNQENNDNQGGSEGNGNQETGSHGGYVEGQKREGIVIQTLVRVRNGPGTSYEHYKGYYFEYQQEVLILDEANDEDGFLWYMVEFDLNNEHLIKWIRSDFVQEKLTIDDDGDFEKYLENQGFPEDYRQGLRELHALYPDWKFTAYKTGIDWKTFIDNESRLGYSLIDGNDLALRSVAEGAYNVSGKYFIAYDGNNWFCANRQTVSYFADPRNFLNKINIFMFLNLSYKDFETAEVVQKLVNGTFMEGKDKISGKTYAEIFYEAGKQSLASPIYLATLAKQEQGTTGSAAIRGESFTYNGRTYKGLYNFYNIGATSGADNWKKGLIYANGGENGSNTSWNRPWTSPFKSIVGGALWIADGYINVGQNTMYLHKFNVTKVSTFGHQYMTNIRAAYSQSYTMYNTFYETDSMENPLVFSIPIFENMPAKTELPTMYKLPTTLKEQREMAQDNPVIEPDPEPQEPLEATGDFIADLNLTVREGFVTGFDDETNYLDVKTRIYMSNKNADVIITNAEGGELKDEDLITTGSVIEVHDKNGESTYTIIILGDLNGDGRIGVMDLLIVKKNVLGLEESKGNALKAGCIDDSRITLKAYLAIKKHILGLEKISQVVKTSE